LHLELQQSQSQVFSKVFKGKSVANKGLSTKLIPNQAQFARLETNLVSNVASNIVAQVKSNLLVLGMAQDQKDASSFGLDS
jgi:hypothetical protein